ncbi:MULTISPECIES: heparinase II/III family protein [unclassified Neorhizobium]|uniref:heparinase II/III domain-containing protein n=1 Tax=unclassified Neorhizobium TaxID=2629175 RepID=UPI001FF5AAC6|nr:MULTISPECIES: heparinase II/III family protein [unclassified Neorhizobium]MCJ9669113.1 heparinase II/III-family protein [Neorhizobium sp. SHOUNA12B]MCJ9743150.1 heparinase II/III-family protein [Neorhizobium sp. SHOUNA12A]
MFSEIAGSLPPVLADFMPGAPIGDRAAWDAVSDDMRSAVIRDAEAALGRPWSVIKASDYREYSLNGNRSRFEALYFSRRRMLNDLVLAELLEGTGRFIDAIIDGVFLICEESGWQLPAHNAYERGGQRFALPDAEQPVIDLFAAETGALLATVAALMKDRLDEVSPQIVARIEREIRVRILSPYLDRHLWWMGNGTERMNNWTAWITQNVLLSTFALKTEQDLRRQIVGKALSSLDAFIKDYAEDGACEEGVVYYRHAALCMAGAMAILDTVAPASMTPLWKAPKIRNMAEYIVNMHVAGRRYFNFADSAAIIEPCTAREYLFGRAVGSDVLAAFAARDRLSSEHKHLPEEWNLWYRVQELLTAPAVGGKPKPAGDVFYPGIGLFVARDDHFALAVKGGNNGESHNHNDVGSLTVYKDGKPFLIDVGVETYTAKTFSSERYDIWTMQSGFHNLPTFGGVGQAAGADFSARNVQAEFAEKEARISLDITSAYPVEARVQSYRRTVTLRRGQEIEVVDIHEGGLPAVLSLMTCVEPFIGRAVHFDGLGRIDLEGAGEIEVDAIDIDDARLRLSWPPRIYRLRIPFSGTCLKLRIV